MADRLLSVGLDVGTTSTQLIVSSLIVQNKASSFAVPEMEIADRQILYKGQVHFTPLLDESHVDADALRQLVTDEYEKAGIRSEQVDTGAIIITGETSRKENARTVLEALSALAGEFVVATAGPDLESVLAAKGAGAAAFSEQTGKTVLHMDIGGGTSNLALIEAGRIVKTGCLNVGGRLLKFDPTGQITYCSPVLQALTPLRVGQRPTASEVGEVAALLTQALEMAAGLRERTNLLEQLWTQEGGAVWTTAPEECVISFSGGVADCIDKTHPPFAFGDMGPALGSAIRKSRLCSGDYRLGEETIRATVIGAGCHSAQLSGSTVFYKNVSLPVKNLPVAVFTPQEQDSGELPARIARCLAQEDRVVLALPGYEAPSYGQVRELAEKLAGALAGKEVWICLQNDMAKALGHALCLRLGAQAAVLCIDRVRLQENSFLDIGSPVGPCLPVVVKTLVLSKNLKRRSL